MNNIRNHLEILKDVFGLEEEEIRIVISTTDEKKSNIVKKIFPNLKDGDDTNFTHIFIPNCPMIQFDKSLTVGDLIIEK